jgi:hypothetical protein
MIADPGDTIKAPLNIGVVANKDSVADFESLKVFKPNAAANSDALSKASSQTSPNSAPHQAINCPISIREPRILLEKRGRVAGFPKIIGKFQLNERISFDLSHAMDGRNGSSAIFRTSRHSKAFICSGFDKQLRIESLYAVLSPRNFDRARITRPITFLLIFSSSRFLWKRSKPRDIAGMATGHDPHKLNSACYAICKFVPATEESAARKRPEIGSGRRR